VKLLGVVSVLIGALGLWATVALADTLVLKNGDRVPGRLIGLRGGVFEFEELRGTRRRTIRVEQVDVRTIELDQDAIGPSGGTDRRADAPDGGRPRGLREREVNVSARTQWTDTGVTVRIGQTIYFEASGRVRWGSNRQDGPEGESDSPRNANRPIPARPAAALIGRIGDDVPFFIGTETAGIRVRTSGTLSLGINDDVFDDNAGTFRVTVYY
jgi:hypothetical protein